MAARVPARAPDARVLPALQLELGLVLVPARPRPPRRRRPHPDLPLDALPPFTDPAHLARALLGQALLDLVSPAHALTARQWLEGAPATLPWSWVCTTLSLDPRHGPKLARLLPEPHQCLRCAQPRLTTAPNARYCPTHSTESRVHHRGLLANGKHAHAYRVRARTLTAMAHALLGATPKPHTPPHSPSSTSHDLHGLRRHDAVRLDRGFTKCL